MKVLYIASIFPKENEEDNIYTDLAEALKEKGHDVVVVVSDERKNASETRMCRERNIEVIRVKTGNLYNVGLFEKATSFITMQNKLKDAINKYLGDKKFDLVLLMAPPITMYSVAKFAMKKFNCISYLMQKDIFPQNALDLGILNKSNPAYWYFRNIEKKLYKTVTVIGCMSNGNKKYLLENNSFIDEKKIELFPNTIKINKELYWSKTSIRQKYNIPEDNVIAIYGGNFGRAQGIDFLIKVLDEYKNNNKVYFILIGKGTEKDRLFKHIQTNKIKNVLYLDYVPKKEYCEILSQSDIGLVFLDHRFTIPNIPSRTLTYFEYSLPIMAATDKSTDYKELIEDESLSGLWCESNNLKEFINKFNFLLDNPKIRKEMGERGRKYLENNLGVDKSVELLEQAFKNFKQYN